MARPDLRPSGEEGRKAIAAVRVREPSVEIEMRRCLAEKRSPGRAKQAASNQDNHRAKRLVHANGVW